MKPLVYKKAKRIRHQAPVRVKMAITKGAFDGQKLTFSVSGDGEMVWKAAPGRYLLEAHRGDKTLWSGESTAGKDGLLRFVVADPRVPKLHGAFVCSSGTASSI